MNSSRELSDVSSIYDTENSLNFTKPFHGWSPYIGYCNEWGKSRFTTSFCLLALQSTQISRRNQLRFLTKNDVWPCGLRGAACKCGWIWLYTNYCEGNELQHLQFFELAGSSHLNIPYEKGAKSTIAAQRLCQTIQCEYAEGAWRTRSENSWHWLVRTCVAFASPLCRCWPLSEQAGYFVLLHQDAGRAIYLPAVIANYFRKYYGEDVTFNIGMQSGTMVKWLSYLNPKMTSWVSYCSTRARSCYAGSTIVSKTKWLYARWPTEFASALKTRLTWTSDGRGNEIHVQRRSVWGDSQKAKEGA